MRHALVLSSSLLCLALACGGGGGGSTPAPTATPTPSLPAPVAPTNLAAVAGDRQVALTWTASASASGYKVKRWCLDSAGAPKYTVIATPTTAAFTDTGLINGTVYRYVVTAYNASGESSPTTEVSGDLSAQASVFASSPTWSDEFNDTDGTLPSDAGRSMVWAYDLGGGGWGNGELETYTNRATNAVIQGGNLVITAKKETFTGSDGISRDYTSARLLSHGVYAPQYGHIEARIKIPKGQGIWPAFWMLGDNINTVSWPTCGECDIMENIGSEPATNHGSLHGNGFSWSSANGSLTSTWSLAGGAALGDDFHTYAIDWVPDLIQFSVDGHVYMIRSKYDVPAGYTWPFNAKMFFILNVAVGGGWPGNPDPSIFPQQMLVDYVRVYGMK